MRTGATALGSSSMPPSDRRSPWPVVAASVASVAAFVLVLGVAAYLTRDASGAVSNARPIDGVDDEPMDVVADGTTATAVDVLEAAAPVVEKCFQNAVAFDPSLGGSVRVKLTVNPDGTGRAEVETKGASPIFAACVARAGATVKIPPLPTTAIAQGRFALDAAKGRAVLDESSAALFR